MSRKIALKKMLLRVIEIDGENRRVVFQSRVSDLGFLSRQLPMFPGDPGSFLTLKYEGKIEVEFSELKDEKNV